MRVRGKHPHVMRESETATIARCIGLLPPVFEQEVNVWKVFGRKDTIVRVGTRATMLTYMKGRRDQWYRMNTYADLSYPKFRVRRWYRSEWDIMVDSWDAPVFTGTRLMCRWYLLGRRDELKGR